MYKKKEDAVVRYIGNFGKWQARTIGIVQIASFFFAWHVLCSVFFLPSDVSYWCLSPLSDSINLTSPPLLDTDGKPILDTNNETVLDNCRMYVLDYSKLAKQPDIIGLNTTACTNWEYDKRKYQETVISEFDLVCDQEYLKPSSISIYMFGIMVGSFLSGILSDRYGRKLIMLIFSCGILVFGIASSFSSSIAVFIILRWCLAVCSSSVYTVGYVYCIEMVGGKWSVIAGIGYMYSYALGFITLPLVAWIFPAWNHLLFVLSITIVLFIIPLAIPSLVPESPRWMLSHGKSKQAIALLESAAKLNKQTVENSLTIEENISPSITNYHSSASFLDLFRSCRLCTRTIIIYYLFFTNSLVYYGFILGSGDLIPGDIYITFVIGGILELVAYSLTIFALLYLGRRFSLSIAMVLGGMANLLVAVVPSVTGKAAFAQIGKFFITGSFAMVYLYAVELFPADIRGVAYGSASMCSRLGGIVAPFIGSELGSMSKEAPLILFGLMSLLAGLLTLLLPETRNKDLPDTIQEAEQFGKDQNLVPKCCKKAT